MPTFKKIALVAIVASTLCSVACGTTVESDGPRPPTSASMPTAGDFPIRWLATPSLDLTSSDGTFVRAIAESYYQAIMAGLNSTAPGYRRAIGTIVDYEFNPFTRVYAPHVAYFYAVPYPAAPGQTATSPDFGSVAVCADVPAHADWTKALLFFTYRRSGTAPPSSLRGHLTQPITDVFGDWKGVDNMLPNIHNSRRCDNPPITQPLTTELLPPSPGWPNSAA
ncbi:hypothetical protein GS4_05_01990 [Gordonia soli NBRC 108243]|uniref:Uncharacterized protein n=1 Tax=Gordonia soli NBRC 108243 TaxID=1223545 RepID=M0QFA9_9ACTN|nr:hypothetical protein GS4_05_01990 [Gordonia soli NBRC 108243]